jgi:hypothetical protein
LERPGSLFNFPSSRYLLAQALFDVLESRNRRDADPRAVGQDDAHAQPFKQAVPDISDREAMLESVAAIHYASVIAPDWLYALYQPAPRKRD